MLLEQTQKLERKLAQKDKRIAKLERVNQQLSDKLQQLLERYNLKKYQKFSPSSETYEGDGEVLNEAEQLIEDESVATEPDNQTTESAEKAAKPRRPRIALSCRALMLSMILTIKPVPAAAMRCIKWVKKSVSNSSSSQHKSGCLETCG